MSNGERVTMFGSSNSTYGSTDCNMILKTKGKIKIQWGSKFIDLLKDGKLNVDSNFIFSVEDKDDIGNKEGLYVLENGDVWIKIGNLLIPIISSEGTVYVSFMGTLATTSDLKYTALHNIGFYYTSISDVDSSVVLNGVIYIEDELKFYVIVNGTLNEMTFTLPNPITELVIIAKDDSKIGSLYIQGQGIENSIAFDGLYIYTDEDGSLIQSDENIYITIDENQVVSISPTIFRVWKTLVSNSILSNGATSNTGFRLYIDTSGLSWLEVDNILVRNSEDEITNFIYPTYWIGSNNIITDVDYESSTEFTLTLKNENNFLIGDILVIFVDLELDDYTAYNEVKLTINSISELDITVTSDIEIEYESLLETIIGGYIFKIQSSGSNFIPIKILDNNIDIVLYDDTEYILLRIGNIEDLNYTRNNNGEKELITGLGIYSKVGIFTEALYESNYTLEYSDNSSRFASTEWVNNLLPYGTIIMFYGSEIPEGWALCDGTNGTPNLIDRFIVAGTSCAESTDDNSMDYPLEINSNNVPVGSHTHPVSISGESISQSGIGTATFTIPSHTHSLKFVNTSEAKRVETGDGQGALSYHFGGIGSIYKNDELWDATTGSGGIVTSSQWDGEDLVLEVEELSITTTVDVTTVGTIPELSATTGEPSTGTDKTITILPPKYYSLVFIMKII